MKIDRYTKAVLTIIAACLVWISIRDINFSRSVEAAPTALSSQNNTPLKVVVVGFENRHSGVALPPIPVSIQSIQRGYISNTNQQLPWEPVRIDSTK